MPAHSRLMDLAGPSIFALETEELCGQISQAVDLDIIRRGPASSPELRLGPLVLAFAGRSLDDMELRQNDQGWIMDDASGTEAERIIALADNGLNDLQASLRRYWANFHRLLAFFLPIPILMMLAVSTSESSADLGLIWSDWPVLVSIGLVSWPMNSVVRPLFDRVLNQR